jgi:hypothetical protein
MNCTRCCTERSGKVPKPTKQRETMEALSTFHAALVETLTRRQNPLRDNVWPAREVVKLLNDRMQELVLRIADIHRRKPRGKA